MLIDITIGTMRTTLKIPDEPPLGWRFWRVGGLARDPVQPRRYGGTRCIQLSHVRYGTSDLCLCLMESDGSFRLFAPHELLPCADQHGAGDFASRSLAAHVRPEAAVPVR
ncbi:hypothetical protein [Sphingomonas oryzagri]